jgi:hypothetical protein
MRFLVLLGSIAAFGVTCVALIYFATEPAGTRTTRSAPAPSRDPVVPEPAAAWAAWGQTAPIEPAPPAPPVRNLPVPRYMGADGQMVMQPAAPPPEKKTPFDPAAHEEKRRAKREAMSRRRNGPPPRSAEDLDE